MNSRLLPLTLAIVTTAGSAPCLQAGIVTNNLNDGSGSLRAAIATALNGETITFAQELNGATITLTTGELSITGKQLTIDASSLAAGVSLSGNDLHRILLITGNSNVTLSKLDIRNGSAPAPSPGGGAIATAESQLHMSDCTIRDSFATYNGGGILLALGTTSTFDRCRIVGNTASNLGFGGGVFISGAFSTLFRNCVITGNSNPLGGGLSVSNSSPNLVNCTIEGNSGGGIRNNGNSDPTLENSIIWGNSTSGPGSTASQQVGNYNNSNPVVSSSLIQGASGPGSFADGNSTIWGTGNLDGTLESNDPKFATEIAPPSNPRPEGDLPLLATSPALNVGNNLADVGTVDLAGSPRIQDSTVDLGAFEGGFVTFGSLYPSLSPSEDANHNGIPNLQEYAMGFDPSAATNSGVQPTLSRDGGFSFLTVNQRSNALDITAALQTSTDLVSPWTAMIENVHYTLVISTPATTDRNIVKFQLNTSDPQRFYRQGFIESN